MVAKETSGDLDAAIRIYRQILSSSPDMRLYAAQARYRLGICLLRKGDTPAAVESLQAVIRNHPEERDLVTLARESMPTQGGLLPEPWSGTEVAEYRWTIPDVDDGWSLTRIAPDATRKNLRIQLNFYSPLLYSTKVQVDRAGMFPIHAAYRPPNQPVKSRTWQALRTGAPRAYEYGEMLYLLRRMPLYAGWKSWKCPSSCSPPRGRKRTSFSA